MKKKHFGEHSRYIFIFSIFLIVLNVTLGIILINLSRNAIITQIEGRMLDVANTAADLLNGDELEKLTKDDADTPEYKKVADTLSNFWSNIQLKYIYCVKQVGEREFVFTIDPTQPDPGEFGEPVVYTDALNEAGKGNATVDKIPYEDSWGRFYSAYSPVFDSEGKVAGIVAVDFSAEWYEDQIAAQTWTVLIICVLSLLAGGLIVFIVTEKVRRSNQLLHEQLNSLAANIEDLVNEVSITTHTEHNHPLDNDTVTSGDNIRDLSEKINSMQENLRVEIGCVHQMAYIDALTSVGNTTAYMETVSVLDGQIDEGTAAFSVAAFDLNGLKRTNDTYGHASGDKTLIDAANVICRVFGKENVYRVGGDEFVVIVSTDSSEDMDDLFKKFESELEEENKKEKAYQYPISVSKGYSIYQKEKDNEFKTVFLRADVAMYRDKDEFYAKKGDRERRMTPRNL